MDEYFALGRIIVCHFWMVTGLETLRHNPEQSRLIQINQGFQGLLSGLESGGASKHKVCLGFGIERFEGVRGRGFEDMGYQV